MEAIALQRLNQFLAPFLQVINDQNTFLPVHAILSLSIDVQRADQWVSVLWG
ncbi:MAG TPA: hypothetical protein VJ761_04410 [Ktedonobacteraceae bacterium]|nr:hypothetical protein [Ktedonobacteraceae bacterium]